MKIFVTGATGVLGRRAVAQLVAAGADVTGVARTQEKAAGAPGPRRHARGGEPVRPGPAQPRCARATRWSATSPRRSRPGSGPAADRVERDTTGSGETAHGTSWTRRSTSAPSATSRNRSRSCTPTGATTFLDESAPVDPTCDHRVGAGRRGRSGAVRRPGRGGRSPSASAPSTAPTAPTRSRRSRRPGDGLFAVPGPADAYWPSVTTDDAASAVVAALGAPERRVQRRRRPPAPPSRTCRRRSPRRSGPARCSRRPWNRRPPRRTSP